MIKIIIQKCYALYHYYSKYRLITLVPGVQDLMDDYTAKTDSTGTKYPTLYKAVKSILQKKPSYILECGTGTSTLVLAETILLMQKKDPSYRCKIISMESIPKWYDMACALLPAKYSEFVEIRLGERELYEYSMFRGYSHSNIPEHPYDFVFLDGPNYTDGNGGATCMDAIRIRLLSNLESLSCVVDTRVSSVFMMQTIFGSSAVKYYPFFRTCVFEMTKIKLKPKINSDNFSSNFSGKLTVKYGTFFK